VWHSGARLGFPAFTFIPQYGGINELALYNNIRSTTQIGTKTTVDITLLLDNDAINVDKIKTNKSNVTDVLLDHRTLYKDGQRQRHLWWQSPKGPLSP
jgi:hypothetical protein